MYSNEDRFCPIAQNEIGSEICYETIMCLTSGFAASSVPEVEFEKNETTIMICDSCPYSDLE